MQKQVGSAMRAGGAHEGVRCAACGLKVARRSREATGAKREKQAVVVNGGKLFYCAPSPRHGNWQRKTDGGGSKRTQRAQHTRKVVVRGKTSVLPAVAAAASHRAQKLPTLSRVPVRP